MKENQDTQNLETTSGQPETDTGPKGTGWRPSVSQPPVEPPVAKKSVSVQPKRTGTALRIVLALILVPIILFMSAGFLDNAAWYMTHGGSNVFLDVFLFLILDILAIFALVRVWKRGSHPRVVGEARGIQSRQETDLSGATWTVLSFVLERYDKDGNRLTPAPVEMRGRSFKGFLNEGDWVEVRATWKKGKALRASHVYNMTTESAVEAGNGSAATKVGTGIVTIIALVILIPILLLFIAFLWSLIRGY